MPELEFVAKVRDFVEQGGDVLLVIAFATAVMWAMIFTFRPNGEGGDEYSFTS